MYAIDSFVLVKETRIKFFSSLKAETPSYIGNNPRPSVIIHVDAAGTRFQTACSFSRLEKGEGGCAAGGAARAPPAAPEARGRDGGDDGSVGGGAWGGMRALHLEALFR